MLRLSNAHFKEAQRYEKTLKQTKRWLGSQPLESMVGICVWTVGLEPLN